MADVYVAFVREDQSFAEALAIALQGSGFAVSRSTSVVDAITECPAIIVLWSAAAARSRLFMDAAERAHQSGKMVLARLSQEPVPAAFGGVEVYGLQHWRGDPEDTAIDPVVFHVDRLVSRARLGPNGGQAPPPPQQASARGVVHPFPAQAAGMRGSTRGQGGGAAVQPEPAPNPYPPQPAPAPAPSAPSDPLAEEAAYWRRIQNSNDPADFEGYLARYGERGTFAELAVDRIRKLRTTRPQQAAPPPPQQRGGFPINAPPPRRSSDAARIEPHPARSRPRIEAPPSEPRGGGGFGRTILLLFLLAGLAGAGWWAFSRQNAAQPQIEEPGEDWTPPPPPSGIEGEEGPTLSDEPDLPEPTFDRAAKRTREEPPARAATPPLRQPPRETPRSEPAPAASDSTPAPVLRRIEPATPPAPSVDPRAAEDLMRDLTPPRQDPTAATSAPAAAALPGASTPAQPARAVWAKRPSGAQLAAVYPATAQRRNVSGTVSMSCVIQPDLSLSCTVARENPPGFGFGAAALRVAQSYRAAPNLADGRPAPGARITVPITFRAAEE